MATYGLLLTEANGRRLREPVPEVDLLLLERTLLDPPRAGAASSWAASLRMSFPNAALVPYVWHLVSHGPDDGLRQHGSRTLSGPANAFGQLQDTPHNAQAWDALEQCVQALGAKRMVVRTPASLTPGALGRRRLGAFFTTKKAAGWDFVWEPQGLWTPTEAAMLARDLEVTLLHGAFVGGRPLEDDDHPGQLVTPDAWLRVDPAGRRPMLSAVQLDALADHVEAAPATTLIFTGHKAVANLKTARAEL